MVRTLSVSPVGGQPVVDNHPGPDCNRTFSCALGRKKLGLENFFTHGAHTAGKALLPWGPEMTTRGRSTGDA